MKDTSRSVKNNGKFEMILVEYVKEMKKLKKRTIKKYGLAKVKRALPRWFGKDAI